MGRGFDYLLAASPPLLGVVSVYLGCHPSKPACDVILQNFCLLSSYPFIAYLSHILPLTFLISFVTTYPKYLSIESISSGQKRGARHIIRINNAIKFTGKTLGRTGQQQHRFQTGIPRLGPRSEIPNRIDARRVCGPRGGLALTGHEVLPACAGRRP